LPPEVSSESAIVINAYADTSVLVALYVQEVGTAVADAWIQSLDGRLWLTPFHRLELRNAVELRLFRKEITKTQAAKVLGQFADDLGSVYVSADLPRETFTRAVDLAAAKTARVGTRTLDVLHVAAAQELQATSFWTFDERQARIARDILPLIRYEKLA